MRVCVAFEAKRIPRFSRDDGAVFRRVVASSWVVRTASEGGPHNDEEKEPEQARGKEKASASESAR